MSTSRSVGVVLVLALVEIGFFAPLSGLSGWSGAPWSRQALSLATEPPSGYWGFVFGGLRDQLLRTAWVSLTGVATGLVLGTATALKWLRRSPLDSTLAATTFALFVLAFSRSPTLLRAALWLVPAVLIAGQTTALVRRRVAMLSRESFFSASLLLGRSSARAAFTHRSAWLADTVRQSALRAVPLVVGCEWILEGSEILPRGLSTTLFYEGLASDDAHMIAAPIVTTLLLWGGLYFLLSPGARARRVPV